MLWVAKRRAAAWAGASPVDLDDRIWGSTRPTIRPRRRAGTFSPKMDALGSGSDYTAFLDHLGVPAVDARFQRADTEFITRSMMISSGWKSSAIPSSSPTPPPPDSMHLDRHEGRRGRGRAAQVRPLRRGPSRVRSTTSAALSPARHAMAEPTASKAPKPAMVIEGLPASSSRRDQGSSRPRRRLARRGDRQRWPSSGRGRAWPERFSKVNDALDAGRTRSSCCPRGFPGRPWFKHAIYAPGLDHRLRRLADAGGQARPSSITMPAMLAAQTDVWLDRLRAAIDAIRAARSLASDDEARRTRPNFGTELIPGPIQLSFTSI